MGMSVVRVGQRAGRAPKEDGMFPPMVGRLCAVWHGCPAPARCSGRCRGQEKSICCSVGKAIGSTELSKRFGRFICRAF